MKDCNTSQQADPPQALYQHWVHSHEEDSGETTVYRPRSYDFPPSRGREGFEISKDGKFTLYRIAPTDGAEKVEGEWSWIQPDTLVAKFDGNSDQSDITLKIIEVSETSLKVK